MENESLQAYRKVIAELTNPRHDDTDAKNVGIYLFYFLQLEQKLQESIVFIVPELQNYFDRSELTFEKIFSLWKSTHGEVVDLALVKLLEELRKIRNKLAHKTFIDSHLQIDDIRRLALVTMRSVVLENRTSNLEFAAEILIKTVTLLNATLETAKFTMSHSTEASSVRDLSLDLVMKKQKMIFDVFKRMQAS